MPKCDGCPYAFGGRFVRTRVVKDENGELKYITEEYNPCDRCNYNLDLL